MLHGHLPWVRRHGTYPCGEEWLFQAASESLLPLLGVLERLARDGHRDVLTLGLTPVLAEQLADPYLLGELHGWLGRRLLDLQATVSRSPAWDRAHLGEAWRHHWQRQSSLLAQVEGGLLASGLVEPFAALARAGVVELLGGPATHPYLPLLADATTIRGQIADGLATTQRLAGLRPRGVWTPECAYRPAGTVADPAREPFEVAPDGTPVLHRGGDVLPGLEAFWAEAGVDHLVLDAPTLARAVGAPARDWSQTGGAIEGPGGPLDVLDGPVWVGDTDVAVFGRNLAVSYAVWNPHGGYPTDPWYRDFYAIDAEGGFKSWRVGDRESPAKPPYVPAAGRARAQQHAREFVALLHRQAAGRPADSVVVAAYDLELLGHWWYEGPHWLEAVLRLLFDDPGLQPSTLEAALEASPPQRRLHLPESSWGRGKGHAAWVCPETRCYWRALQEAQARFPGLPPGPVRDAAWRQLCLAAASDWPFEIAKGGAAGYAADRAAGHLADVHALCDGADPCPLGERDDPHGLHTADRTHLPVSAHKLQPVGGNADVCAVPPGGR